MKSAPIPSSSSGGILLTNSTPGALPQDCRRMLVHLERLELRHCVETATVSPSRRGGVEACFRLRAGLARCWAPGFDTLDLAAQLQLDTARRFGDLEREIMLAMLLGPLAFEFPSHAELASSVRMRRNIVLAARKTALAFYTSEADRPDDCWTYGGERGFTLRPGQALIAALQKATQPEASGRRYAFSCCRATEYVMLLGIAQELESANPPLLAALQRQWERRAIKSDEFRGRFLREHGSMQEPLPPRYYVPGDRVWFRNPDPYSCNATGYEGSWVLYLGSGLFTNFWTSDPAYTFHGKCLEMFQWRHTAYRDDAGDVRIDEALVTARLNALAGDPAQTARILQQMLRLRDPQGVAGSGGCLDASREYPRWVCPDTADLALPPDAQQARPVN